MMSFFIPLFVRVYARKDRAQATSGSGHGDNDKEDGGQLECWGGALKCLPRLLTEEETRARRSSETHKLPEEEILNSRRGAKEGCGCQRNNPPFVVQNDNGNCFAAVLLFSLMAAAAYSSVNLPDADEVAEHAEPFFDLVRTLLFVNDPRMPGLPAQELKDAMKVCMRTKLAGFITSADSVSECACLTAVGKRHCSSRLHVVR